MSYFEGKKDNFWVDIEIGLGLLVVASSLYSYFHKTPWPADFNLILVCMAIYYLSSYTWWYLKKYANIEYFKWYKTSFKHDSKQGPVLDDELNKFISKHGGQLEGALLKVGSKAELYSENYSLTMEVVLKDKKVLKVARRDPRARPRRATASSST